MEERHYFTGVQYDINETQQDSDFWTDLTDGNFESIPVNRKRKNQKNDNADNTSNMTEYVSGTAIKNHLLKDPVLDWYDLHYDTFVAKRLKSTKIKSDSLDKKFGEKSDSLDKLFENGIAFEKYVNDRLKKKFGPMMVTVNNDNQSGITMANFNKTVLLMKKGIPIISQAVLINQKNKTRGVADLLVRSDYLNEIVKRPVISKENLQVQAPSLKQSSKSEKFHYRVIDIKWTTMTLCSNGYTIRNLDKFPCYKGQLAIYNSIVGQIQGYTPQESYIMAKSWQNPRKHNPESGYDCFDLLGVVNYATFDKPFIQKTIDAVKWVNDVRTNGSDWSPFEPKRSEMYPNMSNHNDAPWTEQKKECSEKLGELTQIWCVSEKHRSFAHSKGIMSWKDKRCNSITLGIDGDKKPNAVDSILKINRGAKHKMFPKFIENDVFNWQTESPVDFFVDFETINTCFCDNLTTNTTAVHSDIVFMIGVGYCDKKKWKYQSFIAKLPTVKEEGRIFSEFCKFVFEKCKLSDSHLPGRDFPGGDYVPRFFHWSQAEITNLIHVNSRHDDKWKHLLDNDVVNWIDMYDVFTSEPIVVKGAFNFKLKEIGQAMFKLGFVKTKWPEDGPTNGLDAMIMAIECYEKKNNSNMELIEKYNEIDCKMVYEIVLYLRKNNCH